MRSWHPVREGWDRTFSCLDEWKESFLPLHPALARFDSNLFAAVQTSVPESLVARLDLRSKALEPT